MFPVIEQCPSTCHKVPIPVLLKSKVNLTITEKNKENQKEPLVDYIHWFLCLVNLKGFHQQEQKGFLGFFWQ